MQKRPCNALLSFTQPWNARLSHIANEITWRCKFAGRGAAHAVRFFAVRDRRGGRGASRAASAARHEHTGQYKNHYQASLHSMMIDDSRARSLRRRRYHHRSKRLCAVRYDGGGGIVIRAIDLCAGVSQNLNG